MLIMHAFMWLYLDSCLRRNLLYTWSHIEQSRAVWEIFILHKSSFTIDGTFLEDIALLKKDNNFTKINPKIYI